jgi:hypothetical protein
MNTLPEPTTGPIRRVGTPPTGERDNPSLEEEV